MSEQSFGKYTLLKKIATGGMAEVWLARQTGIEGFQRTLVVKRILPHLADDPEFVQMFLNEAKIAARFNHPNIAQIYDLGETNGQYYIAMEFIHGEDLGRLMRKAWSTGQWIARPLAIRIVAACCEGLFYAHARTDEGGRALKVVHRDISPQNILISFDGSVKLVDFGIAKAADQASLTKSGAIKGKFAYMSPEQAAGKALDHRSDLFAIGLVLYELLTGVRPLKRDSEIATLQAALECAIEPPSQVADVPSELDPVVMKALAKAADDRYRDARQFQLALEEFLVSQRWVASSVQISELMSTLFQERLDEEARLGHVDPGRSDSQLSLQRPAPEPEKPPSQKKSSQAAPAADMSWDAPPGTSEVVPDRPRTNARSMAKGNYRITDPAMKVEPPPDVPAWEAPAGAPEPSRRRTETQTRKPPVTNETAIARAPSRPETRRGDSQIYRRGPSSSDTRIAPVDMDEERAAREERDRELDAREEPQDNDDDEAPTRPQPVGGPRDSGPRPMPSSRRSSAVNIARAERPAPEPEREDELQDDAPDDDDAAPTIPPPSMMRRKATPPPPQPPPRRATRPAEPAPKASVAAARSAPAPAPEPSFLDLEKLKLKARQRQIWVLYALLGVVGLVALAVFWQPIMATLTDREGGGQDVSLKVISNLPVRVLVRHHKDEGPPKGGQEEELVTTAGAEPIRGAHLRDTVILENKTQGARYEKEIEFGQPDEVREIRKEFSKGFVRFTSLGPRKLDGLPIYMDGLERGKYKPGLKLELYEGKHLLELHDESGDVVGHPFEVDVKGGEVNDFSEDLTKAPVANAKGKR